MAYDTTEAVAKFLSGFQMEITNRERDTVAPDYYVKYSLTLSKGCKGDIYKMVQMAQYVCFKSDLYDHCDDICRYGTLDQLRDMGSMPSGKALQTKS